MKRSLACPILVVLLLLASLGLSAIAATGDAGTSPTATGVVSQSDTVFLPTILNRSTEPLQLHPRWLRSLVVAPGETGRLVGITNEGYLMSSTDRGANWTLVSLPEEITGAPLQYRGFVGMDYNHPSVLYIGARSKGLWRSTDGGATWALVHPINAGPVTVGLDDPNILWAGIPWTVEIPSTVAHSEDGGSTWLAAGSGVAGDPVSPILIDPQDHSLLYLVAEGPRGGATLYRTGGAIWEPIPNAPLGTPPSGGPGLGLAMNGRTRGLYLAGNDGLLSVSFNAHALNTADVVWQPVYKFPSPYLPIPLAVGTGPDNGAIFVTLFDWFTGEGRVVRSDDGGATWTALTIPPPTSANDESPPPTASHPFSTIARDLTQH